MLKFPERFLEDDSLNAIVEKHINDRLLDLVEVEIELNSGEAVDKVNDQDKEFAEIISGFFPVDYLENKVVDKILGLRALLQSEDKFVPGLVMEYVLYEIIQCNIEVLEDGGKDTVEKIKDSRDLIIEAIYKETIEICENKEEIQGIVDSKLAMIEDLKEYRESCFWDTDFALLDSYTEEQLVESELNDIMGIGAVKETNKFVIPKEWHSK